jgi:hypothetical protein
MPIPEGYLPRKGDVVLIKARAKRDAYPDSDRENASIQCYFEVVGHEGGTNFFVRADEIHSLYARNWDVGDMVFGDGLTGPAEVLAVDGFEVQTVSGATLEAFSPDDDKRIIADLLRALNDINKQIFETGAPRGTEAYFKIRGLAVDAIKRAGGKVD